jgi:hypothetical protein
MSTVVANGHTTEVVTKTARKKSPVMNATPVNVGVTAPAPVAAAPKNRKSKNEQVEPQVTNEAEKKPRNRKTAATVPVATPQPAPPAEKKTRAKASQAPSPAAVAQKPAETKTNGKSRRAKGTTEQTQPVEQKQSAGQQSEKKEPKQPRVPKVHANAFAEDGVVTAMSRVRDALDIVINATHERVVNAIQAAYNKAKPVVDAKGNKQMPAQGPQTPISQLPADIVQFINEAEAQYKQRLVEKYEQKKVEEARAKDEKKYQHYMDARKKAMEAAEEKKAAFNLYEFNVKLIPGFYDGLNKYISDDILTIGHTHTSGQIRCPDEWTRAIAVVNKTRIHFSKSTKVILSSFLDNIPRQFIMNGITNILQAARSQVKLEFCLNQTTGFEKRLTLLPFLQTLPTYNLITKWVHECYEINQFNVTQKGKVPRRELPKCPAIADSATFRQSVGNVFNSVRTELINNEKDEQKKEQLQALKFSEDTRFFCSGLIHEAIVRFANAVGRRIAQEEKKTIRPASMINIIREMMDLLGIIDADAMMLDIETRWKLFDKVSNDRRESNREKLANGKSAVLEDQNEPEYEDS